MKLGSNEWSNLIVQSAQKLGVHLDSYQTHLLVAHARELIHWNKRINLTSIKDPLEIAVKHFVDSLSPAPLIPPYSTLLDIGSGGGFPGIPLKVAIPSLAVTLIDASRKKVSFLKHVIRMLKLPTIEARHIRAENLANDLEYTMRYDVIVSRALSKLDSFVAFAYPLLAENGVIIALKGRVDRMELNALKPFIFLPANDPESKPIRFSFSIEAYTLPVLKSQRSLIVLRKTKRDFNDSEFAQFDEPDV